MIPLKVLPKIILTRRALVLLTAALVTPLAVSQTGSGPRSFVEIGEQEIAPTVRAILPIDETNVFFLNRRGQIGVAKFSPGLSQIGWEFYSEVKLNAHTSLAMGPNYSVVTASPSEVTQGFDTNTDGSLDFFQALITEWPGQSEGATITAGPVPDGKGNLLFALSPAALKPGDTSLARIVAWNRESRALTTITESNLQIGAFAVSKTGLLAARLYMPNYDDGYYISLTSLPEIASVSGEGATIPRTLPSLLIPAELTQKASPTQLSFFTESDSLKLLVTCPGSKQLIEIRPELSGTIWGGSILLRKASDSAIESVVEMAPGSLLAGGDEGFSSIKLDSGEYRISNLSVPAEGITLDFTKAVDRFHAVKPESYSVKAFPLSGGESSVVVQPVVESDGKTVVLKTQPLPAGTVLRIICLNVPSEDGDTLLSTAAFYTKQR